ncbi:MAG: hypothetical protein LRY38_04815 [Aeromonadaceae bacterium]|nr:hypothetical protein [Aeromonadaceae bacterium]
MNALVGATQHNLMNMWVIIRAFFRHRENMEGSTYRACAPLSTALPTQKSAKPTHYCALPRHSPDATEFSSLYIEKVGALSQQDRTEQQSMKNPA